MWVQGLGFRFRVKGLGFRGLGYRDDVGSKFRV